MNNFACHICEHTEGEELFTLRHYPAYLVPLPPAIARNVQSGDLTLWMCGRCGHMQIPKPDEVLQKLIYEKYYNYYVVDNSEALVPHYRTPFVNFINELDADGQILKGNLLEIGCSAGERIPFFSSISKTYTGIDPSDRIRIAMEKYPECTFIQGYFPDALNGMQFDTVVTQFNLEHILDISGFIENIYDATTENGMILIQVPDCQYFLRTHQPNFLAHEHIQYFVKDTLKLLLARCNFHAIAWGDEGPSLITAAVKKDRSKISIAETENFKQNRANARHQRDLFNEFPEIPDGPLVFYGVGPQLYWLLNAIGNFSEDQTTVVDDNPQYHGQGLPGYRIVIQALSPDLIEKKTIILSLNKIYHLRVIDRIKSFNKSCRLMYIKDRSWVVENI